MTDKTLTASLDLILGRALRALRRRESITQDELAQHLSIAQPSLSLIEGGQQAMRTSTLLRLESQIGMSPLGLVILVRRVAQSCVEEGILIVLNPKDVNMAGSAIDKFIEAAL